MMESGATYDAAFEKCCAKAQANYEKDGRAAMVMIMLMGDDQGVMSIPDNMLDIPREFLEGALKTVLQTFKAEAYIIVSEAWMIEVPASGFDLNNLPKVSEHPNKFEILQVCGVFPGYRRMRAYRIAKGKVLGMKSDLDSRKDGEAVKGIFPDLLEA